MMEILQGKKFKCAFCGGRGIQPHSLSSKCISCRGKGEVEFEGPVIECSACQGSGRVSRSLILSCIRCRGAGVVEKDEKAGEDVADPIPSPSASYGAGIMGERLGEITKRLQWVRKEAEKKEKEIEKKLEPVKPFIKEVSARGGSAFGGKKEGLCLKELGKKLKKAWGYLWED